jgi:hypothetical protein
MKIKNGELSTLRRYLNIIHNQVISTLNLEADSEFKEEELIAEKFEFRNRFNKYEEKNEWLSSLFLLIW